MNPQDNPTHNSLSDDAQLTSADGGVAVDPNTLTLAEMNSFLGKDFKDKASALTAVKETFSFVGKRKEDIAAEVRADLNRANTPPPSSGEFVSKSEMQAIKNRLFFSENPQFKGYEPIIQKMGTDPAEVVASPEFKTVFEKGKVADEVAQRSTVVPSNARLAQTKSNVDEAVKVANARGTTGGDVAAVLAKAINEEISGQ